MPTALIVSLIVLVLLLIALVTICLVPWKQFKKGHKLYLSKTTHSRFNPKPHTFKYPVIYFGLDLDQIDSFSGYNKIRVCSIRDCDYINKSKEPIKKKLIQKLHELGVNTEDVGRIELITTPRVYGIGFNPLSTYYCFKKGTEESELLAVLLEVNNTFKERHWYVCDYRNILPERKAKYDAGSFLFNKEFHVSPYNHVTGYYKCHIKSIEPNNSMDLILNLYDGDRIKFMARVYGTAYDLGSYNLLKTLVTYPLTLIFTFMRIVYQAIVLYIKGLTYLSKPEPSSIVTVSVA